MIESGWYPPGAEFDPNAPWNEVEIPQREFNVTCSQSLSKTVSVLTDNYTPCVDEGFEDGVGWHDEWADTSDTCWRDEYHDNDYHTPDQLISLFKQFLEEQKAKGVFFKSEMYTDWLIEECSGWTEDETEYIES